MEARAEINAGVCGFATTVRARSQDGQMVEFEIESGCEKITALAGLLGARGAIDAYGEMSPVAESVILSTARAATKGCCAACVVPSAIFKAMQTAAGLALPQEISIRVTTEQ